MLDPITAVGLASNIIQLVDFGVRIINSGRELATKGTTEELLQLETIIQDNILVLDDLKGHHEGADTNQSTESPNGSDLSKTGKDSKPESCGDPLQDLAHQARDVAKELSTLLHGLKLDNVLNQGEERPAKRRRTAAKLTVKGVFKQKEVRKLQSRLDGLQKALIFRISASQW
jgi:hypothetical protein